MEEKRKSKRVPIKMQLWLESLYKSGEQETIQLKEEILIINISNTGMGFICGRELPVQHYFNAKIMIDEEKMFYSVLRIVRTRKLDEGYEIGCEFVGLANILSENVDKYALELEEREKK